MNWEMLVILVGRRIRHLLPKDASPATVDRIAEDSIKALASALNRTPEDILAMFMTEDEKVFGRDVFVYCHSHLNPHSTGWCTVPASEKVLLRATTDREAREECVSRGFKLFDYEAGKSS